jgi:hypothetical protein
MNGLEIFTVTIAEDESLSNAIRLGERKHIGIVMPADWDAANLTFQTCNTVGGTFQDLYDDAGVEVTVVAAADRNIGVDVAALKLAPWEWVKLRSGTAATPVAQGAARTIKIVCKE